jgi:6-phosphogluconolactonase
LPSDFCYMYIGTFTPEYKSPSGEPMGAPAKGVSGFRFNSATGEATLVQVVPGLVSPSWLTTHPELPVLYVLERRLDPDDPSHGALSSYAIHLESGELKLTSKADSVGASPPHASIHPSGRHAYVAHYGSGQVVALPVDHDGRIGRADRVIQHEGASVHRRQKSPHPHQVRPAANGHFITVSDLGTDRIVTYPTGSSGEVSADPSGELLLPPGTGPRHHAIHPSGRFLFLTGEINGTLSVVEFSDRAGAIRLLKEYPIALDGCDPASCSPAEVVVHPSGKVVYVSVRGNNSIAVFDFDENTSTATLRGSEPTGGRTPRNFAIDPSGTWLVVANQDPGSLVMFQLNPDSLWPERVGSPLETPSPTCVTFWPPSAGSAGSSATAGPLPAPLAN